MTGRSFLSEHFLQPLGHIYNFNILFYVSNASTSIAKFNWLIGPDDNKVRTYTTVVFHNINGQVHFEAMSQPYDIATAKKTQEYYLLKVNQGIINQVETENTKGRTDSARSCEYKVNSKINGGLVGKPGKEFYVFEIKWPGRADGDVLCEGLRLTATPPSDIGGLITWPDTPADLFEVKFTDFRGLLTDEEWTARDSIPSSKPPPGPTKPGPTKPPPGPTKPGPTKPPSPAPRPSPTSIPTSTSSSKTGFTETLGSDRPGPVDLTGQPGLNGKLINIINQTNAEIAKIMAELDVPSADKQLYENYPEFLNVQIDSSGKIIVPTIDEERVKDYNFGDEKKFAEEMKMLNERVAQITREKPGIDADLLPFTSKLSLLNSMLNYPQIDHIENYLLIDNFFTTRPGLSNVVGTLEDEMGKNDSKLTFKRIFELGKVGTINPRNFLSLIALIARNSQRSMLPSVNQITLNKFLGLQKQLNSIIIKPKTKMDPGSSNDFSTVFTNFFTSNPNFIRPADSIISYLSELIYQIYVNGYEKNSYAQNDDIDKDKKLEKYKKDMTHTNKKFALSKEVIKKRIIYWIIKPTIETNQLPINYILDRFSEEDKKIMMKEMLIIIEINRYMNSY